jgi:hypothetical protein
VLGGDWLIETLVDRARVSPVAPTRIRATNGNFIGSELRSR